MPERGGIAGNAGRADGSKTRRAACGRAALRTCTEGDGVKAAGARIGACGPFVDDLAARRRAGEGACLSACLPPGDGSATGRSRGDAPALRACN
jgi:hypothetical protein